MVGSIIPCDFHTLLKIYYHKGQFGTFINSRQNNIVCYFNNICYFNMVIRQIYLIATNTYPHTIIIMGVPYYMVNLQLYYIMVKWYKYGIYNHI